VEEKGNTGGERRLYTKSIRQHRCAHSDADTHNLTSSVSPAVPCMLQGRGGGPQSPCGSGRKVLSIIFNIPTSQHSLCTAPSSLRRVPIAHVCWGWHVHVERASWAIKLLGANPDQSSLRGREEKALMKMFVTVPRSSTVSSVVEKAKCSASQSCGTSIRRYAMSISMSRRDETHQAAVAFARRRLRLAGAGRVRASSGSWCGVAAADRSAEKDRETDFFNLH